MTLGHCARAELQDDARGFEDDLAHESEDKPALGDRVRAFELSRDVARPGEEDFAVARAALAIRHLIEEP